jgi:hypothetical protein
MAGWGAVSFWDSDYLNCPHNALQQQFQKTVAKDICFYGPHISLLSSAVPF